MDVVKELSKLDYVGLITGIVIVAISFKGICSFCIWLIKLFGLETKKMRQRREEHELLIKTSNNLNILQEKQEEDVKQSIRHDEMIKKDLTKVSEKMDEISLTLETMQKRNDITEMKKLKEKLVGYYNKYKNSDGWSSIEKEVFWDLFEEYESKNGDGFIHTEIEPVMRNLKVIDK